MIRRLFPSKRVSKSRKSRAKLHAALPRQTYMDWLGHRYALAAQLTTTSITWEVIGLDSNKPAIAGPNQFLIGARITNTGTVPVTGVSAAMKDSPVNGTSSTVFRPMSDS